VAASFRTILKEGALLSTKEKRMLKVGYISLWLIMSAFLVTVIVLVVYFEAVGMGE
jgi:hypothetical protein